MEAMAAVVHENAKNPDILVLCALLHDAIEDSSANYDDIKNKFDTEIADGVSALTKNPALPTKIEQMKDSIARIQRQPHKVWMVKLYDRITNLQASPKHWEKDKIAAYHSEAQLILESLGDVSLYLSKRLIKKISEYKKYLWKILILKHNILIIY